MKAYVDTGMITGGVWMIALDVKIHDYAESSLSTFCRYAKNSIVSE